MENTLYGSGHIALHAVVQKVNLLRDSGFYPSWITAAIRKNRRNVACTMISYH